MQSLQARRVMTTPDGNRPAEASARVRRARWARLAAAVLLATALPSPAGWWPPISLILWALIGDPRSTTDAFGSLFLGLCLLAAYATVIFWLLRLVELGLRRVVARLRSRRIVER